MKRRNFIKNAALSSAGIAVGNTLLACTESNNKQATEIAATANISKATLPLVIATWHVIDATAKAMEVLQSGGTALDAVEQGCRVEEARPIEVT